MTKTKLTYEVATPERLINAGFWSGGKIPTAQIACQASASAWIIYADGEPILATGCWKARSFTKPLPELWFQPLESFSAHYRQFIRELPRFMQIIGSRHPKMCARILKENLERDVRFANYASKFLPQPIELEFV